MFKLTLLNLTCPGLTRIKLLLLLIGNINEFVVLITMLPDPVGLSNKLLSNADTGGVSIEYTMPSSEIKI